MQWAGNRIASGRIVTVHERGPVTLERTKMLTIRAECSSSGQQAIWEIDSGQTLLLGRSRSSDCAVPWDQRVSRRHAEVTATDNQLIVKCLPDVSNLIWQRGQTCEIAEILPGDSFRIGQTEFRVNTVTRHATVVDFAEDIGSPTPGSSVMLSAADVRLALVSHNAASLWSASDDKSLASKAIAMLQQVLSSADLFVILSCDDLTGRKRPGVVHWYMQPGDVQPAVTRELVNQSMSTGSAAMLVETDDNGAPVRAGRWSFCVPIRSDASIPWCIYISGTFGLNSGLGEFLTVNKLKPDVMVTELVAHLTGAVRSVRSMEHKFEGVRQFFSPQLMEKMSVTASGQTSLDPRETNITALYCDLRGFSRMVSQGSDDLHGLLDRISNALGVMTRTIIEHQGVIADFQGDSALGFWGWPLELTDGPLPACRAALQIQQFFEQANEQSDGALKGFLVGIGIATGRAIAGRIGTRDHAKIGVFGPVVNVASRLEGLTKQTGASILMDEQTAAAAADGLQQHEGRCRPIGQLLPAGFDDPLKVSELLPRESQSPISNSDIDTFASALASFRAGEWDQCRQMLARLPPDDRPRDFLLVQIASQNYHPPADWSGVIRLESK
jgi:adenylate cyclase